MQRREIHRPIQVLMTSALAEAVTIRKGSCKYPAISGARSGPCVRLTGQLVTEMDVCLTPGMLLGCKASSLQTRVNWHSAGQLSQAIAARIFSDGSDQHFVSCRQTSRGAGHLQTCILADCLLLCGR